MNTVKIADPDLPHWDAYHCRFCNGMPFVLIEHSPENGGCVGNCGHPANNTPAGMVRVLTTLGEAIGCEKIKSTGTAETIKKWRVLADAQELRIRQLIVKGLEAEANERGANV